MIQKFNPNQLERACLLMQILTDEFREIQFEFSKKDMDAVILAIGQDQVKYFLNFFKKLTERVKEYYPY